ncbi:hypothetical protein M513_13402 [Trichuris suis]|uniref:CCHC-type domain-containing protein n=1 Tax=Trichuris suis TaxID=68888 RepID=A0A085LL78_9BILA|nr:hypothetical protein M513_13402 [Trichuris suis]
MARQFQVMQLDVEEVRRYQLAERSGSCVSCKQLNKPSSEDCQKTTRAMEAGKVDSSLRRAVTTCFICGRQGHMARDCSERRRSNANEQPSGSGKKVAMSLHSNDKVQPIKMPSILVGIGGQEVEATIDTGAAFCFVQKKLVLSRNMDIVPWTAPSFKGIDGGRVVPIGKVNLTLSYQERLFKVEAAVLSCAPCRLVLGTEALMKMGIGIRFSRDGWRIDRPDWVSQTAAEGKDSQPTGDIERAPASKPHMDLEEMRHRKKGSQIMIAGTLAEDETPQPTSLEQLRFGEQLSTEEKECLVKLANSFEQLFDRLPAGKGNNYAVKHRIPTGGANPIVCRPYRVSVREREAINQQVEEMLREGVIEESHSPWAFPVVMYGPCECCARTSLVERFGWSRITRQSNGCLTRGRPMINSGNG